MSGLREVVARADPALVNHAAPDPGPGRFQAVIGDPDRAFVLEAVYEGHLMHHGEPRAFDGMDPDLRLLAGDSLYALGLARLAELGDLAAVAELADLISLTAWAQAEDRTDLVEGLWEASAAWLSGAGAPGVRATLNAQLGGPPGEVGPAS